MTGATAIIIGAIIGVFSGLIGAGIAYRAEQRKRAAVLFSNALDFLGGGTQRRNLGIAAISLYWREFPRYSQLCAEMLIGSAIYLLNESKQKGASHEIFNLHRIMALLIEVASALKNRGGYGRLKAVVDERISRYDPTPERGLWVSKTDLQTWHKALKNI